MDDLDYPGALSRLLALRDQEVAVGVRAASSDAAMVMEFNGPLRRGGEVYGGNVVGYHPDALTVNLGDVSVTLHPTGSKALAGRPMDRSRS